MRKALAALLLFLASVSAALAQQSVVTPSTMVSIPITGAIGGPTTIINGLAGKSIYITGMMFLPGVSSTFQLTSGPAAACAAANAITPVMTFPAAASSVPFTFGDGYGAILVIPAGHFLCITVGAAAIPGTISYAQF